MDEREIMCYCDLVTKGGKGMRDLPFFTTNNGVASLTLSEIAYTHRAYIRLQQASDAEALLTESVQFCRAAGAESIYATGHKVCEQYPFHTAIIKTCAPISAIGDTDAALFPVTEETADKWRDIYNSKVIHVPNGAWMSHAGIKQLLRDGDGYFIHRDDLLLGIGKASADTVSWVASVAPGAGEDVVKALCHALSADTVCMEVATTNTKAMQLYERFGFVPVEELSRWYTVAE